MLLIILCLPQACGLPGLLPACTGHSHATTCQPCVRDVLHLHWMYCRLGLAALQSWQVSSEPCHETVAGAGEGVVGGFNEEASPSLRHLPHVGQFMDHSFPGCPPSLLLLAECFDPILLLLCPDHKLFPLLPCGFGPKLGSSTTVAPVVSSKEGCAGEALGQA